LESAHISSCRLRTSKQASHRETSGVTVSQSAWNRARTGLSAVCKRSGYLIQRCSHEKTREQLRFTILEVAADWHELMVPRRGMQPSTARDSGQVDPRRSTSDIPSPQSTALGLHPIACRLLLINRPRRDGTLSWRWYTAATGTMH